MLYLDHCSAWLSRDNPNSGCDGIALTGDSTVSYVHLLLINYNRILDPVLWGSLISLKGHFMACKYNTLYHLHFALDKGKLPSDVMKHNA